MMKSTNLWAFGLMALFAVSCSDAVKYKDSTQPVEVRVNDLLGRMTLEEKASQLDMLCAKDVVVDGKNLSKDRLKKFVDDMCIGSVHDLYPETADIANEIQKHALENTRLGIPLLFIEEGLHGYSGVGSTTFPAAIGNSCTWDTTLVNKIGHIIGTEARIHGVHFILGPNLDVAHEIRWGRVEETFGEDPYLTSRMAVNLIKGMQGKDLRDKHTVSAEPKHFGVHGIPDAGLNACSVNIGEREARTTHLYTFEKAVTEGGANGIMAAYHDLDGTPCSANHWLLTDVLRDEWGFKGMVVSDLGAVREQVNRHFIAKDAKEAICNSLNAGLNMQFYDFPYDVFQKSIVEAVKNGELDEKVLDKRVSEVLRLKFRLGLFDDPYVSEDEIKQLHHCQAHKDVALQASNESLVLLKNDGVLPFNAQPKRITLVGELANLSMLGGYSPSLAKGITVFEALKARFGKDVAIDFIESQVENTFKSVPNSVLFTSNGGNSGIHADFFNNGNLEGAPSYSATVPEVTNYWHNLSPAPGINRDNFSARWEGVLKAPVSGTYEIKLQPQNGDKCKLFMGDKLMVDKWADMKAPETARIQLTAGQTIPVKVEYAEINENAGIRLEWRLLQEVSKEQLFERVTRSASMSDATILVLGEGSDVVGEGKDRQDLNMCERDIRLLEAVEKAGKPAATVVLHGRPFVMTPMVEHSKAIVDAWFPGEFGGKAIVDVLFGSVNPSGKLCISVPRTQGQLPVNYLKKRSTKKRYADGTTQPLFVFGHGLSYTTFEYSDLKFSSKDLTTKDYLTVSFKVKNTGKVKGTEVCQLYITDLISSVSLAEKSLRGFSRVELEPGEEKVVSINLKPEHFSLINREMKRVVEPGDFEILIGASSSDIKLKEQVTLK